MLYQTCFQRGFEILKKQFIFKKVRQFNKYSQVPYNRGGGEGAGIVGRVGNFSIY